MNHPMVNSMAFGSKGLQIRAVVLSNKEGNYPSLGAYNLPFDSIKHLLSKTPPRPPYRPWLS
ncbi:MAG: hypothetical protein SGJ19_16200 [Planctomycetia bacterium]|nr:hypothetical protein [Planctomycetia bacterium]